VTPEVTGWGADPPAQVIPPKIIEQEVVVGAVPVRHKTAFIGREMEAGIAAGFADGAEMLPVGVHPEQCVVGFWTGAKTSVSVL